MNKKFFYKLQGLIKIFVLSDDVTASAIEEVSKKSNTTPFGLYRRLWNITETFGDSFYACASKIQFNPSAFSFYQNVISNITQFAGIIVQIQMFIIYMLEIFIVR